MNISNAGVIVTERMSSEPARFFCSGLKSPHRLADTMGDKQRGGEKMKKIVVALLSALILFSGFGAPAQAVVVETGASTYQGCVSRKEFMETRRKMSQRKIQRVVYGTKANPVKGKVLKRTEHRKKVRYRGCNPDKWDNPKVVVLYRNNMNKVPDEKFRVYSAVGTYIPKTWV